MWLSFMNAYASNLRFLTAAVVLKSKKIKENSRIDLIFKFSCNRLTELRHIFIFLPLMKSGFKFRPLIIMLIFMAVLFIADACTSTNHHRNKKLKPGKPIPCPQKDC